MRAPARIITTLLATALLASGALVVKAEPEPRVEVVATFDASLGELPEGVAFDRRGNAYVSLGPPFFVGGGFGEVREIAPDGQQRTLVTFPGGPAPAGLAVTPRGDVYAAVPEPGGPDVGIYRISRHGDATRIDGTEAMLVPNGLALSRRGTLYATDSLLGQVWRLRRGEQAATPWLSHEWLAGCEPGQLGANGIVVGRRSLDVASSDRGLLLRIPIKRDGSPGAPRILAGDPDCDPTDELWSIDGIARDRHGHAYAALVLQNRLVRIDRDGSVETLRTADDGLWNPASVAFGSARRGGQLFVTNYAVLPPAPPSTPGPALLAVEVGHDRSWP